MIYFKFKLIILSIYLTQNIKTKIDNNKAKIISKV